ncbi:mediator of RNA polymeras-like protein II transcription subunit 16 [Calycina marina]|uniref:Mediator of RNA polymerase II transcription subunit 16 n=1 Tax=Calycina marina TaxID=1763456 RepID=A0A9P7Z3R4_9HELO|nr:mediator of RNA polymeras-like protein II transcription subunit 16 [Calycina marina]
MDDMQVDDLFGDDAGLSLMDGHSLQEARPPTKELYLRQDELRASGCCQEIAWSKLGIVASITPDGCSVRLQNPRCNPVDGSWALGQALKDLEQIGSPDLPLKHLAWSPHGVELAVVDSVGRITILNITQTSNRPQTAKKAHEEMVDDLQRVVGCYWLNPAPSHANRPVQLSGPAVRDSSSTPYRFETTAAPVLGPSHPNHNKSAFVCVSAGGCLKVIYPLNPYINPQTGQHSPPVWREFHTELESISSSDDLITHAAICSDKPNMFNPPNPTAKSGGSIGPPLLITFATTSKQLRTVRALIDWNIQQKDNAKEKPNSVTVEMAPFVKSKHIAATSWLPDAANGDTSEMDHTMLQLSKLEILPPSSDSSGRPALPPTIITIRSYLPPPNIYNQEVRSIIDSWEVREKQLSIHPAFEQLGSKKEKKDKLGSVVYHKKGESCSINKFVLSVQTMNFGTVLLITYSDGGVEYRDRTTFQETFLEDGSFDRVWHLTQLGWAYNDTEPCLQSTVSSTNHSMAQITNDGTVKWRKMEYKHGGLRSAMDDKGFHAAANAAFAITVANCIWNNINYDDILAAIPKDVKSSSYNDWLLGLSRILQNMNCDYSEDTNLIALIRNTPLQFMMGINLSLGFNGENRPRSLPGKFAWITLQIRAFEVSVTMAYSVKTGGPRPFQDPEMILSLVGSVNWTYDLMAWIIDNLSTIQAETTGRIDFTDASTLSLPELLNYLKKSNNIALHLLLSSVSRGFLSGICKRLITLDNFARQNSENIDDTNTGSSLQALIQQSSRIYTLTNNSIVKPKVFDTFLASVSTACSNAYNAHRITSSSNGRDTQRNDIEHKMVLGGAFPDAFKSVLIELFRSDGLLSTIRSEIDLQKLMFHDFSILELDEDEFSVRERKKRNMTIDCFRKTWLRNPPLHGSNDGSEEPKGAKGLKKWRRCARCSSVMEEPGFTKPSLGWLSGQQKRCYCAGLWDAVDEGKRSV